MVDHAGQSFGWPCREGTIPSPGYREMSDCAPFTTATETEPVADYPRCPADNPPAVVCGSAAIGGPEYRGQSFPSGYDGSIFIGDYTSFKIFRLQPDGNGGYGPPQVFSDTWLGTDLEIAPGGNDLAYVEFGWGTGPDGSVRRVSYQPGNASPTAVATSDRTDGQAPLTVRFNASGSSDPDGDALSYDWDFGDGSTHSTAAAPTHTYTSNGSFSAKVTVSDGRGRSASKTIVITAGGSPPRATIEAPTAGALYRDGEQVQLRGSATDPDDGTLGASRLNWQVILHHGEHTHFDSTFPGVGQATFNTRRDHDADSFYEVRLTATDSQGLTHTATTEIRPRTTTARIASTPAGAPVSYGGRQVDAPFDRPTAIGYETTVTAAARFTSGGRPFLFERWADGPTGNVRDVTVPDAGVDLRALYYEDKSRGMPASASSSFDDGTGRWEPDRAVDGDGASRWSSGFQDGQHWQVDLGRPRSVDRVQIDWENAYASRYQVLTSLNGTSWSLAGETTQAAPGSRTTSFATRTARYVRVLGLQRATQYGISFFEARVLGPDDDATAPETTIDTGPAGNWNSKAAAFTFSGSGAGASFECRLDAGAWAGCTSPRNLTNLAEGAHTFEVRATGATGVTDPTPASRTFTVDSLAPETTINLGPAQGSTSANRTPQFTFASELGATFECSLDGATYAACTSAWTLTSLGDGQHTFAVRAKDATGNVDPTPASRTFSVDATPPQTTLTGGPSGLVKSTSASFTFTGESGGSFDCKLDGQDWATCSSPKSYSGLGQGPHTFSVLAKDAVGNPDATPATRDFTVDTVAPTVSISAGPNGPVADASPSFTFAGEAGASFKCALDGAAPTACTSPKAYPALSQGSHTFAVEATDPAGNTGTAATRAFSVDTVGPTAAISAGPAQNSTITSSSTGFSFTGGESGGTYECKLDGGDWAGCATPKQVAGLDDGVHTFSVRAKDALGNAGATVSRAFTVDTAEPNTTVSQATASAGTAQFEFAGPDAARYQCSLDSAAPADFADCSSPKAYSGLADGVHTFRVRGISAAGVVETTPAVHQVTLTTPAPPQQPATPGAPTPPPAGPTETPSSTKKPAAKPAYGATVLGTRGLEAMFGLGDNGRWAADARRGIPGRFMGSPKRVKGLTASGRDRYARAFDGTDDRLQLDPGSLGRPRAFSVELWVDAARNRHTGHLITAAADRTRDGFWLALDAGGRPVLSAAKTKGIKPTRVVGPALGTSVRHLTVTFDGRRLRLYVDGRLRQSAATAVTWSRTRRLVLGADEGGRNPFKGTLDELSLYDRALSAGTVKAHFTAGR